MSRGSSVDFNINFTSVKCPTCNTFTDTEELWEIHNGHCPKCGSLLGMTKREIKECLEAHGECPFSSNCKNVELLECRGSVIEAEKCLGVTIREKVNFT